MWPWRSDHESAAAAGSAASAPNSAISAISAGRTLLVEADRDAVAVLHFIVAPLQPQPRALARLGLAARLQQLVPRHHFGANETFREIAVDLARGIDGLLAAAHGPGAHLVLAHGEEGAQTQQPVAGANHRAQPVLLETQLGPEGIALLRRQPQHLALEQRLERDRLP